MTNQFLVTPMIVQRKVAAPDRIGDAGFDLEYAPRVSPGEGHGQPPARVRRGYITPDPWRAIRCKRTTVEEDPGFFDNLITRDEILFGTNILCISKSTPPHPRQDTTIRI